MIRELERDDAPAVVRLELDLNPHQVLTGRGLVHELEQPPLGERRRDWVAVEDGEVVGHGTHETLLEDCVTYQEIVRSQLTASEAVR